MNKLLFALVPLALLAGCAVDPDSQQEDDAPNAGVDQALTSFEFDTTALAKITPPTAIPSAHLTLDKLADTNVAATLLGTTEKLGRVSAVGNHTVFQSTTWSLEEDRIKGRILGISAAPTGTVAAQDPTVLQRLSLDRLAKFGIGSGEIGRVLQRKSMLQDFDGTAPDAPTQHGYKTFVFRGIGGVPVQGHRAVISHGLDGAVRRVLLKWPALANTGHALRTSLTTADIQARATTALARQGESTGKVFLFWQYLPVQTTTGEVTLRLSVGARMRSTTGTDGITEEPRTVDVDVSAL